MTNNTMIVVSVLGVGIVGLIAYKALSGPEETTAPAPTGTSGTQGTPYSAADIGTGVGNVLGPLAGFIRTLRPTGTDKSGDSASPTDTTSDPFNKAGASVGASAGASVGASAGALGAR